jgi:hypothetical protein
MRTVGRLLLSALSLALAARAASTAGKNDASAKRTVEGKRGGIHSRRAENTKPAQTTKAANDAPLAAGYVVHRDPDTGALTLPSASEIAALGAAERTRLSLKQPLLEQTGGKGGTMVRLKGQFRNYMTVQVGSDGRLASTCTQDEEAAHVAR